MIAVFLGLTVSFSYVSAKKLNTPVEKMEYRLEDYYLSQLAAGVREKEGLPPLAGLLPLRDVCCILAVLDHYSALAETHSPEFLDGCKTKFLKTCREKIPSRFRCGGFFPEQNSAAVVLNFTGADPSFLPGFFRELQGEFRGEDGGDPTGDSGFSLSLGIGRTCAAGEVRLSYDTARQALSRRLLAGPGSLIPWEPETETLRGYFYPYDQEEIIFNHLHLHSQEAAIRALGVFFQALGTAGNISMDNVIQACNQLLGGIIKYMVVRGISSREIFAGEQSLYGRLSKFEFLEEIEAFFKELLENIIRFELREDPQKGSPLSRILDQIRANLDKPFDLNRLSGDVGLSYSHVRRVFTGEMGEGILSYVYKLKVEQSKKLLLETALPVAEISRQLGFYNKQSFYRFFKKFEGITPHKYREASEAAGAD
jgi:AraC-like DNA-binding protein